MKLKPGVNLPGSRKRLIIEHNVPDVNVKKPPGLPLIPSLTYGQLPAIF
jgi:hypothetical protein